MKNNKELIYDHEIKMGEALSKGIKGFDKEMFWGNIISIRREEQQKEENNEP